ncbi:MAG TPA: hypothetical protein VK138_13445 [Acidiferrobacterales bacterium]|nr:hypothetical protein [Acidiferrobacterales bacterium]
MFDELPDRLRLQAQLLDQYIAESTKEELTECARLLALNVAHYHQRYGELPLEQQLNAAVIPSIDEKMARLMVLGIQEMIKALTIIKNRDDHKGLERGTLN